MSSRRRVTQGRGAKANAQSCVVVDDDFFGEGEVVPGSSVESDLTGLCERRRKRRQGKESRRSA